MEPTPQQRLAMYLIPVLLALYALPIWVVAVDALFGNFGSAHSGITTWFASLIAHPDSSLNLLHKIFLPITTFVTVAVIWKSAKPSWIISIVVGLLLTIAASIYLMVQFGIPNVQRNVVETVENADVQTLKDFFTLATSFVNKVQEVLATYLLTLLGMQAAAK